MRKYLILSIFTLVMLFVLGNNAYATTENYNQMSINIPSRFELYSDSSTDSKINKSYDGEYSNYGVQFHYEISNNYTGIFDVDQILLDNLAKSHTTIYEGSTYTKTEEVISKSIVKISGVNAARIRMKRYYDYVDDSYVKDYANYFDIYYFFADNYRWFMYGAQSDSESYFNTSEYKNMINSIVIKDTVKETRVTPFTDVQTTAWYYEAVKYCYTNNYINGKNSYTFGSNDKITRGMLVTILYGMEGAPKVTATNKFSDVASNKYYYNAVRWASSKGIVNGSNGKFRPDDNVTRQDLAVILSAYCNYKGKYVKTNYGLTSFSDSSNVSSYALTAVKWAVKNKIISGTNGKLNPKGNATRAEAATMIYSFCLKFK